eukprot:3560827-Prymnesium_polylepis.1
MGTPPREREGCRPVGARNGDGGGGGYGSGCGTESESGVEEKGRRLAALRRARGGLGADDTTCHTGEPEPRRPLMSSRLACRCGQWS